MRALILADIDELHWYHGRGHADLVLAVGDTADSLILEAANAYGAPRIFAVKGNHDATTAFTEGITDLHLARVEFGGLTFGGFHGAWRYKPRGPYLFEQAEVAALLAAFPSVDIFVAHNSPQTVHAKDDGIHTGFAAFDTYIAQRRPRWFIHGHQHVNRQTVAGATNVIGVYGYALLDLG